MGPSRTTVPLTPTTDASSEVSSITHEHPPPHDRDKKKKKHHPPPSPGLDVTAAETASDEIPPLSPSLPTEVLLPRDDKHKVCVVGLSHHLDYGYKEASLVTSNSTAQRRPWGLFFHALLPPWIRHAPLWLQRLVLGCLCLLLLAAAVVVAAVAWKLAKSRRGESSDNNERDASLWRDSVQSSASRQTGIPTVLPTVHPSSNPSALPSLLPTRAPSAQPSATPTQSPSRLPTQSPSITPSILPSATTSLEPLVNTTTFLGDESSNTTELPVLDDVNTTTSAPSTTFNQTLAPTTPQKPQTQSFNATTSTSPTLTPSWRPSSHFPSVAPSVRRTMGMQMMMDREHDMATFWYVGRATTAYPTFAPRGAQRRNEV